MALVYSRYFLKHISSSFPTRWCPVLWKGLTDCGISRVKPTRKSYHEGLRKLSGAELGPLLFLIMINDLSISMILVLDDTTTSEIIGKAEQSNAQAIADEDADWPAVMCFNKVSIYLSMSSCD